MTEAEAKREGHRARRSKLQLPYGHPYAAAPLWAPLSAALVFEQIRLALTGKRRLASFVLKR